MYKTVITAINTTTRVPIILFVITRLENRILTNNSTMPPKKNLTPAKEEPTKQAPVKKPPPTKKAPEAVAKAPTKAPQKEEVVKAPVEKKKAPPKKEAPAPPPPSKEEEASLDKEAVGKPKRTFCLDFESIKGDKPIPPKEKLELELQSGAPSQAAKTFFLKISKAASEEDTGSFSFSIQEGDKEPLEYAGTRSKTPGKKEGTFVFQTSVKAVPKSKPEEKVPSKEEPVKTKTATKTSAKAPTKAPPKPKK